MSAALLSNVVYVRALCLTDNALALSWQRQLVSIIACTLTEGTAMEAFSLCDCTSVPGTRFSDISTFAVQVVQRLTSM